MTCRTSVLFSLLLCTPVFAQDHSMHAQARPVTLVSGLGNLHHPVSTKNAEAQKFFDQGLRFIYAFNHDEAARSFQHAGELDPKLAIAYWGVAEAVGPNYNDPASDDRFKQAHEAIQKGGGTVVECFTQRAGLHPGVGQTLSCRSRRRSQASG